MASVDGRLPRWLGSRCEVVRNHWQKVGISGIARRRKSGSPSGNGPETRANTGNPTACKAVYIGSIPVRASKRIKDVRPLLRAFSYMHSGNIGGVPLRFCSKTTRQRDDCAWTRVHHANEATAWRYAGTGSSVRKLATEAAALLLHFRDAVTAGGHWRSQ